MLIQPVVMMMCATVDAGRTPSMMQRIPDHGKCFGLSVKMGLAEQMMIELERAWST